MHPVIEHLNERRNKKGPFNDGRKIGLVLPGGMMAGVIGAGAVTALEKLGLAHSFDVIFTASAGFPNASYLLTENCDVGASIYYEELRNRQFINFLRFWEPVKFDKVVEAIKIHKPLDYKNIWDSRTELYLKINNSKKESIFLKIQDQNPKEYLLLLKGAISFPFLSKGVHFGKERIFDGGITDQDIKDLLVYAIQFNCTDLLIIYNLPEQKIFEIPISEKILEILPNQTLSRFETDSSILRKSFESMKKQILEIFKSSN